MDKYMTDWQDSSTQKWKEAVTTGATTMGLREWLRYLAPTNIVAIGTVPVYVYMDGDATKILKVIVDDSQLTPVNEMKITYASDDLIPLQTFVSEELAEKAVSIMDMSDGGEDWPEWQFHW